MKLKLDYSQMLAEFLGPEHGISADHLTQLTDRLERKEGLHERFQNARLKGELGFPALVYDTASAKSVEKIASGIRADFESFVLLGIGGSALGPLALQSALTRPFYNLSPAEKRGADGKKSPQVFICDNIDPDSFAAVLKIVDLKKTFFNVVSKSGATTETLAQFLCVQELAEKSLGPEWKKHFLITTDPKNGELRALAEKQGIQTLSIPMDVGGRFSVLSPVGLLTAAVCGVDVQELLEGARTMLERCEQKSLKENPAYLTAALLYIANTRFEKSIIVLMPYSDALVPFSDWYAQLYAESLGKKGHGMTPVSRRGVTDQHSQLQLYLDGPNDKVIILFRVEEFQSDVSISQVPLVFRQYENLNYLGGLSFKTIMQTELMATRAALTHHHRPNLCIHIPSLNADICGQLLMLFELQVAFSGLLYQVDPFDQPAVELGKKLTYHLLGRSGYESKPAGLMSGKSDSHNYFV